MTHSGWCGAKGSVADNNVDEKDDDADEVDDRGAADDDVDVDDDDDDDADDDEDAGASAGSGAPAINSQSPNSHSTSMRGSADACLSSSTSETPRCCASSRNTAPDETTRAFKCAASARASVDFPVH